MKKNLYLVLFFLLTLGSVRADLLWYEGYNYPNGRIDLVSTNSTGTVTNWNRHSGTVNDALVTNHMEQVFGTGGAFGRTDDVHRNFPSAYTGSKIQLYASMSLMVTNLPGAGAAGCFAHFLNGTGNFSGKLFCTNGTLPGTYRLGCAGGAATASALFPVDLCTNIPYQVVISFDPVTSFAAQLWVNPLGSSDTSVTSFDTVASTFVLQSFAFRQASGMGAFASLVTNLATATTFDEAATNVWSTNAVAPKIAVNPLGFTNFVGVSNGMYVLADGQSQANLTYTWRLNGTPISNPLGNTNVYSLPNPQTTDSGDYTVVVTTPYGLSTTTAVAHASITFAPVPPSFTQQPSNVVVYPGQTATMTVATTGPGPISYQWNYNGSPISGANDSTLAVTDVVSNNGTAGTYECDAINVYGTTHSSNVVVSIIYPPVVTIGYLRGLVDPVFYLPTNTTAYYTTTGTVISKTNFTTSANDECFITDGTGSISVFYGGSTSFRPNIGDVVTVTGPLAQFNSLMEFSLSATDPSTTATIISTGNPAPVAKVLSLSFTNSPAYGGASNALRLYGGSLAMFTNVTFLQGGGTNVFAASGSYTMMDASGNTLTLFVYSGFSGLIGQPIPTFCYSVTGVLSEFLSATATNRSSGYQLEISDPADLVTVAPTPMTLSFTAPSTLTWAAVPYSYPYSVYSSTNVTGPYTLRATGLIFPTSTGSYTETNTSAKVKFYRVTSP